MAFEEYWTSSGAAGGGGGDPGDAIGNSLRFRATSQSAGSYLHRTGFDNNGDVWTFSCWMKGWGPAGTTAQWNAPIFSWHNNTGSQTVDELAIFGNYPSKGRNEINFYFQGSAAGNSYSNDEFNDASAWYHVVWRSAGTNQVTLWINNRQVTNWRQTSAVTSQPFINKNQTCSIGARAPGNTSPSSNQYHGEGYLAQVYFVDGTAQNPDQFGRTNDNGIWVPVNYAGTYGNNGFHLDFSDPANIGEDSSGNNNDFTPVGFELATQADQDYDSFTDSPTQNWATLNPIQGNDGFHEDGVTAAGNLGAGGYPSSTLPTQYTSIKMPQSGRYYVEWITPSNNLSGAGITYNNVNNNGAWVKANTIQWFDAGAGNNTIRINASTVTSTPPGSFINGGGIAGALIDMDVADPTITFTHNGANAQTYTVPAGYDRDRIYFECTTSSNANGIMFINYGQKPFANQPANTEPLQTQTLPAVDIQNGRNHFACVTYNGNSAANAINIGFQPDFVWIKSRSHSSSHGLYDSLRGVNRELRSDVTSTEFTFTDSLNSFDTTGFTLGTDTGNGDVNLTGRTYIAWCWSANEDFDPVVTGVTNPDGRRNVDAGFSILTYTGNNSSGTITHGLSEAPEFIIFKRRNVTDSWLVYHEGFGATRAMFLDTASTAFNSTFLANTAPTNTTITLGGVSGNNGSGNFVAYCWHSVPGYSKFGTYVPNNNANNCFVYCGFRPAVVMLKANGASNYVLHSNEMSPANPSIQYLSPDNNLSQTSGFNIDILSNGFKLRSNNGPTGSASECVFAAWAENPFGGSNTVPVPAR